MPFKDRNFFEKIKVSSINFILSQKVHWSFNSIGLSFLIESNNPDEAVEYSFDGKTVHGDLVPLLPSEGIIFDNRIENSVWFRKSKNTGNSVIVRVEAWRNSA